ncbi:virulence protein [Ornithobacterium rhinotracheale]|uniref:virulence protein n=1 Tax=Ornithobacterium rhinotracheale TaxID=28251 RepID=UPI00129CECDF|nr:virulence protein [Ornithobacterium rhinotracheale]MRJ11622.1 virulence protein [Ornithobacterium rhinotracheale]
MFAITFDMEVSALKEYYGEPYHKAYYDIRKLLKNYGFKWTQGSVYLSRTASMADLFDAIDALTDLDWFSLSVRDIQGFKVEDWSDFTNRAKRKAEIFRKNR